MRRLPPLTAIEAFVQVARLGSVKAAAEELALSSPALSRRVQALERFMGRSLFERRHQSMMLSSDGEMLLSRIAPALDALTLAIDSTSGDSELVRLRLAVMPLFASQRLMGRLPELRQRHPELHIDIDTGSHALARLGEGVDAAIVLARDIDSSLYSRRIDRDTTVAIVNRSLLSGRFPVSRVEDLGRLTIFLHRDMPELFTVWREALGRPDLEPAAVDVFDSGQLMLDAAAQGLGVAFMLRSHLEDSRDERLTKLFDEAVESPYGYWFACRRPALSTRAVRVFHDWLFSTLSTS
ncbi:LysR substrate-binding domain-containing protein [Sphingomonas sp. SRS2]|uniref:LysR substrate-binding domain-containing protein n=1 Tax=Sphingomonas sp. SRS2 TaxID=133190 RepID=UPI0006184C82|nr:LysR substrate-binding domain-containing protein [Sphingomonas sp. SRS2]KKC26671.1 LysR family transcriptional regulator [Sphingomonas sp. SRS2]